MKRLLLLVGLFLVVCLCLVGCSGGSPPQLPVPQLAGQWEIIATSRNPVSPYKVQETHIEVNFNEDSQGNLSAPDPILFALVGLLGDPVLFQLGGYCGLPGPNPISGSVKTNNNMNFTWTEGAGVQYTASGQLQNGTVTGSYSGGCPGDVGTFVASRAQNIAGTYVGSYIPTGVPSLTLTITAANGNSITVNGSDSVNGNFTLQGTQIGNCVVVSGTIGVLSSTFYGLLVTVNTTQLVFFDQNQNLSALLTKQ